MVLLCAACRPTGQPAGQSVAPIEPASTRAASESQPSAASTASAQPEPPAEPAAAAIATVNGIAIPLAAFHAIYHLKVGKYAARGREIPASADRRYRHSIYERLVDHELLRQAADKLGLHPDLAELSQRETQQKRGISDWAKHLERRGETEQSLRAMYEAELRERLLIEQRGLLTVTAADIDAEYKAMKSKKPRSAVEAEIRGKLAVRKLHESRRTLRAELRAAATIIDNRIATIGPEPRDSDEVADDDADRSE